MTNTGSKEDAGILALEKHVKSAQLYQDTSPAVALIALHNAKQKRSELRLGEGGNMHVQCQYCGMIFKPDNHHVTLKPRMRLSKKIKKLLRWQQTGKTITKQYHSRLLTMYSNSRNRMLYHCKTCKKVSIRYCESRDESDRRTEAQKQKQQPAEDSTVQTGTLSKSARKKKKRKQRLLGTDSGVSSDNSFISESPSLSQTPVTGLGQSPVLGGTQGRPAGASAQYMKPSPVTPFGTPSNKSQGLLMAAPPSSKKKDKKNRHKMLQNMLAGEAAERKSNGNNSLQAFLDSVK